MGIPFAGYKITVIYLIIDGSCGSVLCSAGDSGHAARLSGVKQSATLRTAETSGSASQSSRLKARRNVLWVKNQQSGVPQVSSSHAFV